MKTKILCTGSCGFILGNLIRNVVYKNLPYDLVSIDKIVNSSLLNNIYVNKTHQLYIGDVADEHFVNTIFDFEKPDYVIHGAALSCVDASFSNQNDFFHTNVLGTQVMASAAAKHNVKRFVHLSTDEVMGELKSETEPSWTENSPFNPLNIYSGSKAASEMVMKAVGSSFKLNYCITRSCNNIGPRQSFNKLIPKTIKSIIDKKPIEIYSTGSNIRSWIWVGDNVSAIMKIMEEGVSGEVYNIGANMELSNLEMVQMICNTMGGGHELITHIKDPRPHHDFRYSVNNSKIRSLGWEPTMKLKQAVETTVKWYQNNQWVLK